MSDFIQSLPTDDNPLSAEESKILKNILKQDVSPLHNILIEFKFPLICGIIFFIFNNTNLNDIIKMSVPYANNSDTSLLFIKTIFFIIIVFITQNYIII